MGSGPHGASLYIHLIGLPIYCQHTLVYSLFGLLTFSQIICSQEIDERHSLSKLKCVNLHLRQYYLFYPRIASKESNVRTMAINSIHSLIP